MNACPHCGDENSGYYYSELVRYRREISWDGEVDEGTVHEIGFANSRKQITAARCIKCNRIVDNPEPASE